MKTVKGQLERPLESAFPHQDSLHMRKMKIGGLWTANGWKMTMTEQLVAFPQPELWHLTLTSAPGVFEQIRTHLRHSCGSLPPLSWTNSDIRSRYDGESSPNTQSALVTHFTADPGHTGHNASVCRPVCTEEDITASPRTEPPRGEDVSF